MEEEGVIDYPGGRLPFEREEEEEEEEEEEYVEEKAGEDSKEEEELQGEEHEESKGSFRKEGSGYLDPENAVGADGAGEGKGEDEEEEEQIPLLFVDVNLGNNNMSRIVLFEKDHPEDVAVEFSKKHGRLAFL